MFPKNIRLYFWENIVFVRERYNMISTRILVNSKSK